MSTTTNNFTNIHTYSNSEDNFTGYKHNPIHLHYNKYSYLSTNHAFSTVQYSQLSVHGNIKSSKNITRAGQPQDEI